MGKVGIHLTIDSELVEQLKARRINISAVVEEILRRYMTWSESSSAKDLERFYGEYQRYRMNLRDYNRSFALVWAESRAKSLGMSPEELLALLEARYREDIEEGEKLTKLPAIGGSREELIELLWRQYQAYRRYNQTNKFERLDWVKYRVMKWQVNESAWVLLKELDRRWEELQRKEMEEALVAIGRGLLEDIKKEEGDER